MIQHFFSSLFKEIRDLYRFRMVSYAIVSSALKMRYKRSLFGVAWSLLGPTCNYLVVGFVFSKATQLRQPNYYVFLFSGAVIYNLIAAIILQGPNIFINNEHYIKKIYLPKSIFVLNQALMEFVNFSFALASLLILGFLFSKIHASWEAVFLPLIIINALLFAFGVAAVLGVLAVYFRDFTHLIPLIMQAVFFLTPVLYPSSMVPPNYLKFVQINPMYYFVESFRSPLLEGTPFDYSMVLVVFGIGISSALIGLMTLKIFDNKIIFKL